MDIDELRQLSNKIVDNPEEVYNLPEDQVEALRKYLNPYSNVIPAKKNFINLSLTNWKDEYLRKLHMTAMVGYLYRTLEEYTPNREIAIAEHEFKSKCEGVSLVERAELQKGHDAHVALLKSTAKGIIKAFLDRSFEFNPDHHIRGTHSENKADPERPPLLQQLQDATSRDKSSFVESI